MTTDTMEKIASTQSPEFMLKVQKLRELYADAGEISKTALENEIRGLSSGGPATAAEAPKESAGRIGAHQGKIHRADRIEEPYRERCKMVEEIDQAIASGHAWAFAAVHIGFEETTRAPRVRTQG